MAYSSYQGFRAFAAADYAGNDPVGVDAARRLANNAQFFADCTAQVRHKWIAWTANAERRADGTLAADRFYRIGSACVPILVNLHPYDGTYRFRIRLAGWSSQGDSVSYRVFVGHPDDIDFGIGNYSASLDYVHEFTTTSMSRGWLTETNTKDVLLVNEDIARRSLERFPTVATPGSGTVTSACDSCMLYVEVWSSTEDTSSLAWLTGLQVEEYIGLPP